MQGGRGKAVAQAAAVLSIGEKGDGSKLSSRSSKVGDRRAGTRGATGNGK